MVENNKEKKSLKLNKEVLMRLQEEQLRAAVGGDEAMSNTNTATCPSSDTCGCTLGEPATCCKKSCKGGGGGGHQDLSLL